MNENLFLTSIGLLDYCLVVSSASVSSLPQASVTASVSR